MDTDSISEMSELSENSPLGLFSDDDNILRKRNPWTLVSDGIDLLADVDALDDEEEDGWMSAGCPLPSTPEDNQLLEAEVSILYTTQNVAYIFYLYF